MKGKVILYKKVSCVLFRIWSILELEIQYCYELTGLQEGINKKFITRVLSYR